MPRGLPLLLALSIVVLAPVALPAQSGWRTLRSNVSTRLQDVEFLDEALGFVVGDSATALRTTDGGTTWQQMALPAGVPADAMLSSIVFTSAGTGHIAGSYRGTGVNKKALLLNTTDGGDSWVKVGSDSVGRLTDIAFTSGSNGYAVGGFPPDHAYMARTTNGGSTWELQSDVPLLCMFESIDFSEGGTGLAVAAYPQSEWSWTMFRTTNGGIDWTFLDNPAGGGFTQIFKVRHLTDAGWIIATANGIYRSLDDGATWTRQTELPAVDLDVDAQGAAYAVKREFDPQEILKSTDGGASWSTQRIQPGAEWLTAVDAPSRQVAYAVGWNGVILKTGSGGEVVSSVRKESLRKGLSIIRQGMSSDFICRFAPSTGSRDLVVLDALGRIIARNLVEPGKRQSLLNTIEIPPGIYIAIIGHETAMFMLIP